MESRKQALEGSSSPGGASPIAYRYFCARRSRYELLSTAFLSFKYVMQAFNSMLFPPKSPNCHPASNKIFALWTTHINTKYSQYAHTSVNASVNLSQKISGWGSYRNVRNLGCYTYKVQPYPGGN